LTDEDKDIRHKFCKDWLRLYNQAELKRTFDKCVFVDEMWIPVFPSTHFVRYRRGEKPGEWQPQVPDKVPYLFAMTKDAMKMIRLDRAMCLSDWKRILDTRICPWANERLGKGWYLWMDACGNVHGRNPTKPGGKAVHAIVSRNTGGMAEILQPPSYSPDLNVIENLFGKFKPMVFKEIANLVARRRDKRRTTADVIQCADIVRKRFGGKRGRKLLANLVRSMYMGKDGAPEGGRLFRCREKKGDRVGT